MTMGGKVPRHGAIGEAFKIACADGKGVAVGVAPDTVLPLQRFGVRGSTRCGFAFVPSRHSTTTEVCFLTIFPQATVTTRVEIHERRGRSGLIWGVCGRLAVVHHVRRNPTARVR